MTVLASLSDGKFDAVVVGQMLRDPGLFDAKLDEGWILVPHEMRLALFRLAFDVAMLDGDISGSEMEILRDVAVSMSLPLGTLDNLLSLFARSSAGESADSGSGNDGRSQHRSRAERKRTERDAAYLTLGIESGADAATIRLAHRRLVRKHHPDLAPDHERAAATKRTSELNAAFDLLMGA